MTIVLLSDDQAGEAIGSAEPSTGPPPVRTRASPVELTNATH